MNREIALLYCGGKMWPRLIVTLWTLRKHHPDDTVRVYCATERDAEWAADVCNTLDCEPVLMERPESTGSSPIGKLALTQSVIADDVIYIDADVAVCGRIDKVFGHPLTVTSHGDWTTKGRRVVEQLEFYQGADRFLDRLIDVQLHTAHPHINGGVFGFIKGSEQIRFWQRVVAKVVEVGRNRAHLIENKNQGLRIPADTAFQLTTSSMDCRVLDDHYNCCTRHGSHWNKEPAVRHYCGRRHGRDNIHWREAFLECRELNIGGICDHPGRYDLETKNMWKRCEKGHYDGH